MAVQEVSKPRPQRYWQELPAKYQTLRASRALDIDKHTVAAMRFAILKGLRTAPRTPFTIREGAGLGVTLLEESVFERALRASHYLTHAAIQDVGDELRGHLPESTTYPLKRILVSEIGVVGSKTNPTIALILSAPLVAYESRSLIRGLENLSEMPLNLNDPRPHISIASFPRQPSVLDSVVNELSAVAPRRVNLGPLGFTMFEISYD